MNPGIHLFPYIGGFMAQTWFKAQAAFDEAAHTDWWATQMRAAQPCGPVLLLSFPHRKCPC